MVKGLGSSKKGLLGGENVKDIEKSLGFGVSFIFTLFLSGISGYYFAKLILNWDEIQVFESDSSV